MIHELPYLLHEHRDALYHFFRKLATLGTPFLFWSQLVREYEDLVSTPEGAALRGTSMDDVLHRSQEGVVLEPMLYLAVRESVARWRYVQIHTHEMVCREIGISDFLDVRERIVVGETAGERYTLEVDLTPFERDFPKLSDPEDIGRGVEYLNQHLSKRLAAAGADGRERLYGFLRVHEVDGHPLMLNGLVGDAKELRDALDQALAFDDAELADPELRPLRRLGFEPGWGRTPERVRETMRLLTETLDDPSPERLARFLSRVPMIFSIVIVTPHGYFGQANVLGKPDTGGQVVYILDQVRALERAMRASIHEAGLSVEPDIVVLTRLIPNAQDTTCNERLEPIFGTENARILRVPFRAANHRVLRHWIPRFEVWPYLERFAIDAETELLAELGGKPDMVIGNYSDGNLVATILTHRLGVTQCNVAHALEKTKYLQSDLYWREMDAEHHFACQFTADLIAMNTADFIITSTYQEIAGTEETVGQYESYQSFSLPGLYRVVAGIDCFDPKFNIVSPGADPDVFFPHTDTERRPDHLTEAIRELVLGDPDTHARGRLAEPDKPLLFAMSRLDPIKNMIALLRWYAGSERLRELANLLLVGGTLDPARSGDSAERSQIETMHRLIDEAGLESQVRWIEMQTDKNRVGELYRLAADLRGAFVQPALFEAFGLTIVEAMSSGLPVFVTRFGGPFEIVEHGRSGFHIDPTSDEEATAALVGFLERCREEPAVWTALSEGALARVRARYTWTRYAHELLRLSRIYGFWRYMSSLEREETRRYLEMFYGLMYRPLAAKVARGD